MFLQRATFVLLMGSPGTAFWIHLFLWTRIWDQGHGENWWPVLIQLGLGCLSLMFLLFCLVSAIVQLVNKQRSFDWWIASLVDVSPLMLPALINVSLVAREIFLNHSEKLGIVQKQWIL
jgi:hypothetical protein